jgi:hypothetical protein
MTVKTWIAQPYLAIVWTFPVLMRGHHLPSDVCHGLLDPGLTMSDRLGLRIRCRCDVLQPPFDQFVLVRL